MTPTQPKLEGTVIKMTLQEEPSGRVDALLVVRILRPSRREIDMLSILVGVPRGTRLEPLVHRARIRDIVEEDH